MTKKVKRRLGWIVLVGILLSAIVFFAIALISARTKAAVAKAELAEVQNNLTEARSALEAAKDEEQIQVLIRVSVVSYTEGDRAAAVRFLEYAISKMDSRQQEDLGMLPAKMKKDPIIAKKLGLKLAKGSHGSARRFGGG